MYSVESDGNEVEYFLGQYIPAADVWTAFGLQGSPPRAAGVHPAQPFRRGPVVRALMTLGLVFALLNLGLVAWSLSFKEQPLLAQDFTPDLYLKECVSRPFVVGPQKVMSIKIAAPLNNSWLALDLAMINDKDQVVEQVEGGEISFYQGVEGGESWTEGSRSTTSYFLAPTPGTYRLILKATAGSGINGPPRGEALGIQILQGGMLSRYFLAMLGLALLIPLFEIVRHSMFEKRRWAAVTEDDDDSDWDDDS